MVLAAVVAAAGGCSDGGSSSPRSPAELGIDLTDAERCDVLVPGRCLLPLPNDFYTVADATSPTGRRVRFVAESLPANSKGKHVDPTEWNRSDGFSPGSAILVSLPGADLAASGTARIDDIGRSLDDYSPIVVIDVATGERRPTWAELDQNAPEGERTLIVRAAVNYLDAHRYAVAFRGLVDASGAVLDPSPAFRAYRDGERTTDAAFEARRAHLDEVFAALESAGIARDDLQLAFDFTIASTEGLTGRMLRMRDDAFGRLGEAVPEFTVDQVENDVRPEIARRITGTYRVPSYLTGDGGPGSSLAYGADGLPAYQGKELVAPFQCVIPPPSEFVPDAIPRGAVYGHGLLGDYGEVNSSIVREMSARHLITYCATNQIGMAEEDVGNAVQILGDLSTFNTLADRLQQGLLNELFLGRLMRHASGLAANPAFQRDDGTPLLDRDQIYYDGNSQGAILGGALMAVAQDFTRGVLGEAGMNYSFLLQRSVDFDDYKIIYAPAYPDPYDQLIGIQIIQMLWDRGETNGYANHITSDPLPGTPAHTILLLGAVGDHQVSEYALQIEARTIGAHGHVPYAAPDRTTNQDKGWGIEPLNAPWPGSGYYLFDTGSPLSPLGNVPPRAGHDPHDDTPRIPAAQDLKSEFMRPDGVVLDMCRRAQNSTTIAIPCTGEQYD